MTEFEIQRGLRAMNAPRLPQHDLWPAIAARIEAGGTTTTRAPQRWMPLAAAAGTVLAIAGSLLFFALRERTLAPVESDDYAMATHYERITPREAREEALRTGRDPRLAGANIVIDAAHSELQQALEQHPDAVFLDRKSVV